MRPDPVEDPPGCSMHRQSMFIPNFFPKEVELGVDVNYFYLPPIDADLGGPLLVSRRPRRGLQ